ncbi:MAG: primosomal replication protein N [Gammaproteobacteria bacterium]|nr:MAG: primosomal replication protein N [Gammaproteobacteria bacterium]
MPEENRLVLTGTLRRAPETRRSPAGIPISRFILEHHSLQREDGRERSASFSIAVVAAGETLQAAVSELRAGDRVKVQGFIHRTGRPGPYALAVHAHAIHRLP